MSITVRPHAFAFFLLSALFAALSGCARTPLYVYEPVGEERVDLEVARSACVAHTIQTLAPMRSVQIAASAKRAANETNSYQGLGNALTDLAAQNQYNANFLAVHNACMVEKGWKNLGDLKFQDADAPLPNYKGGLRPLHIASAYDNRNLVSHLISKGANVNVKSPDGVTPLHLAAGKNAAMSAEVLLNNGADVDADARINGIGGITPLQVAAATDGDKVAALLIKNGANVNAIAVGDGGPLHAAARHNSRKVAGLLISEGADIDAQGGDEGMTPLHRAALYGHADVADLLIVRGANPDAKTYADETPLDIAKREGKRDVVALLERAARAAARKASSESGETNSADGENSAESVFENAWRSVVVVVAGGSQGGGAVINEPNRVATNCHVVDESPNDIRVYKGENRRAVRDAPHSAEIVSGDRERDVCILSVSGLWGIPAKIRSAAELEIGEAVYAVGAPKGLDFSISNGIVSQLREEAGENAPLIQTNAAISPGSSGGGLFDSEGRLVGLTTWKIHEGENLNFAIPIEWALELE